jgi:hypothetical protein
MPASVSRRSRASAGLPVQERKLTQILAIVLDKVEGIEDRGSSSLATGQLLESRQAVRPDHDGLAVNREALGFDPPRSSRNRR